MPSEKMVGYVMDMKKKLKNRPATEYQPHAFIVKIIMKILASEYTINIKCGLTTRKAKLPVIRPMKNKRSPPKDNSSALPWSVMRNREAFK